MKGLHGLRSLFSCTEKGQFLQPKVLLLPHLNLSLVSLRQVLCPELCVPFLSGYL